MGSQSLSAKAQGPVARGNDAAENRVSVLCLLSYFEQQRPAAGGSGGTESGPRAAAAVGGSVTITAAPANATNDNRMMLVFLK